jgi:predicted acylesterase/phospholipase RssA
MGQAIIPHMPDVRAQAGRISPAMERDLQLSFEQESAEEFPRGADGLVRYAHLAISGGGSNGAFGAGFLNGWTSTGKRPTFKIVTGVSTGALMAPFAFLGPDYDDALREFYTTVRSRDIFVLGSIVRQLLVGESLANTEPLAALIAQHIDAAFLRRIAEAHNRGRRLYIGTSDLDSQTFVVWNMGLIATSGRPQAVDLFRDVMLASASIPVAFPPVFFEVEAGGERHDEMHVDGAVGARVFLNGSIFSPSALRERAGRGDGRADVYVIHNGLLAAVPKTVPRSLRGIALRTLDSAGKSALFGDLWRIYAMTRREQASFQWVTIPTGVDLTAEEVFDQGKMRALYEVGYQDARAGPVWLTRPEQGLQWDTTPEGVEGKLPEVEAPRAGAPRRASSTKR